MEIKNLALNRELQPVISNPDSMFPLWPVTNFFVYCIQIWFKRKYVVKSCAKSFTFVSVHMRPSLTSTLLMIFRNWLWDIYFEITWRFLKIQFEIFLSCHSYSYYIYVELYHLDNFHCWSEWLERITHIYRITKILFLEAHQVADLNTLYVDFCFIFSVS